MRFIKNAPVLLWWAGLVFWLIYAPETFFGAVVALALAGPWLSRFAPRKRILPKLSIGLPRYATFHAMTTLTLTKAAMAHGTLPPKKEGIADRS